MASDPDLFADDAPPAPPPHKGRGATASPDPRFAAWTRAPADDGWQRDAAAAPPTELFVDSAKTVLSRNDSPDLPFDRSLNPYRGCEHGCVYCYARPSHAFLGHSPGLDFETKLYHKPEAAKLLRRELAKPGYVCRPLALGSNTDAWQPVERRLRITRAVLQVLLELKHPLLLITKSALIERDLDLLAAMRALAEAGVPVTAMVAPVIPGLTDHELERLLAAAREAGAAGASYSLLRLPHELHDLFERWLAWHAPEKAARVMAILYDMRGGKANDARFVHRMRGLGHFADLLAQRFELHRRRLGFPGLPALDSSRFAAPAGKADERQLGLF